MFQRPVRLLCTLYPRSPPRARLPLILAAGRVRTSVPRQSHAATHERTRRHTHAHAQTNTHTQTRHRRTRTRTRTRACTRKGARKHMRAQHTARLNSKHARVPTMSQSSTHQECARVRRTQSTRAVGTRNQHARAPRATNARNPRRQSTRTSNARRQRSQARGGGWWVHVGAAALLRVVRRVGGRARLHAGGPEVAGLRDGRGKRIRRDGERREGARPEVLEVGRAGDEARLRHTGSVRFRAVQRSATQQKGRAI